MFALVTNAISPYYMDIARLIALPPGQRYRFRYTREYIASPELVEAKNAEAIVIVREYDSARLTPLLFVKILRVRTYGDVHFFQLEVGRFPSADETERVSRAVMQALAERGETNEPGKDLRRLAFAIPCEVQKASSTAEALANGWDAAVHRLAKLPCYRNFSFLRVGRLARIDRGRTGDGKSADSDLRPGEGYLLEVLQKAVRNASLDDGIGTPFHLRLVPEEGITAISGSQGVVGKYDVLRFSFRTDRLGKSSVASMILANDSGANEPWLRAPDLVLEYMVTQSWWMRSCIWVKRGIGLAGVLATMFAVSIAESLQSIGLEILSADVVRGIALLVVVLSTTGAYAELRSSVVTKAPDINI